MFRGSIKTNSKVTATFSSDFSNSGTAAMVTSYGPVSGEPTTKTVVVAPGGTDGATLNLKGKGLYRIIVDVKGDTDGGRLKVVLDGADRDEDTIEGDVTWLYAVE